MVAGSRILPRLGLSAGTSGASGLDRARRTRSRRRRLYCTREQYESPPLAHPPMTKTTTPMNTKLVRPQIITFDFFGTVIDWRQGLKAAAGVEHEEFDRLIDIQGRLEQ